MSRDTAWFIVAAKKTGETVLRVTRNRPLMHCELTSGLPCQARTLKETCRQQPLSIQHLAQVAVFASHARSVPRARASIYVDALCGQLLDLRTAHTAHMRTHRKALRSDTVPTLRPTAGIELAG